VQDEQVRLRARRDRVGATLLVAELDEQGRVAKLLDDGSDLAAGKPLRGKVRQQCHHVQNRRSFALCAFFHHSTQQVTNLGSLSPVRTIQPVGWVEHLRNPSPCRTGRSHWLSTHHVMGIAALHPSYGL
jgi:hypothetical protein